MSTISTPLVIADLVIVVVVIPIPGSKGKTMNSPNLEERCWVILAASRHVG